MDLSEQLDAAIGDGPPSRPVDEAVRAGRAAVRRRRLSAGAGSLAVALVLGGTAYGVLAGELGTGRHAPPALATSPAPESSEPPDAESDELVRLQGRRLVAAQSGVEVVAQKRLGSADAGDRIAAKLVVEGESVYLIWSARSSLISLGGESDPKDTVGLVDAEGLVDELDRLEALAP